jgi:hypothetical protein
MLADGLVDAIGERRDRFRGGVGGEQAELVSADPRSHARFPSRLLHD